jgi:hypothetical protein
VPNRATPDAERRYPSSRNRLTRATARRSGGALVSGNLQPKPFRKSLEPIGQGQKLISAAEIVSYLVS